MKKTLLLLALVVFISATSFVNSPGSPMSQVAIKSGLVHGGVPAAVLISFDGIVTDIMNDEFPSNTGWYDTGITWTKDKGTWLANGKVMLIEGGGGINVINCRFKNNGQVVSINYTVIPVGV